MRLYITDLSPNARALLLGEAMPIKICNRELLLNEGKTCKYIWYIKSGCVKSVAHKEGREINLNFAFQGEFVTSLKSLREDSPSTLNLQSCGVSHVVPLDKERLKNLYAESEEIRLFGHQLLEKLLIDQEEHSNLFKLQTPLERYNHVITKNPEILKKITLTELASYLGFSRETLTRIRQKK